MIKPTGEVKKLPVWAQKKLAALEMQRDVAVNALKRYLGDQTESRVWTDDLLSTKDGGPEFSRRYIQTNRMTFQTPMAGVVTDRNEIEVMFDTYHPNVLRVSFGSHVIRPTSTGTIEIVAVPNAWGL